MPATLAPARSDNELVAAVAEGDRQAADELIRRHERMIKSVVKASRFPATVEIDDLIQTGRIAMYRAAAGGTFDPTEAEWITYAMTIVRRAVWKEIARLTGVESGNGNDTERDSMDGNESRNVAPDVEGETYLKLPRKERKAIRLSLAHDQRPDGMTRAKILSAFNKVTGNDANSRRLIS